jgi:preprotein translocase subunit SecD
MKFLLFPLFIFVLCFSSCTDKRIRKKPPVPTSDTDLVTGCYYIVEDSTKLKREVYHSPEHESYFIDPKPILTVANFKEVAVSEVDRYRLVLNVKLDEAGKTQWALATEKYNGKKLAFIINDFLVMAPTVMGKIDGGSFDVTGNFKKEELEDFRKAIESDMYEK